MEFTLGALSIKITKAGRLEIDSGNEFFISQSQISVDINDIVPHEITTIPGYSYGYLFGRSFFFGD